MHPIATVCRVLGVFASGYYAWSTRPLPARGQADQRLLAKIRATHKRRRTCGAPRIHAELQATVLAAIQESISGDGPEFRESVQPRT